MRRNAKKGMEKSGKALETAKTMGYTKIITEGKKKMCIRDSRRGMARSRRRQNEFWKYRSTDHVCGIDRNIDIIHPERKRKMRKQENYLDYIPKRNSRYSYPVSYTHLVTAKKKTRVCRQSDLHGLSIGTKKK